MYLVNVSSTSGIDLFYFHNHLSRNLKRSHISNLQIHEKHMHSSKDRFATEYFGFDCAGMVRASVVNKIFHTPTPPGVKAQSTQVHSLWVTLLSSPRSWHSIGTRKPFPAWQRQTWTLEKSHKILVSFVLLQQAQRMLFWFKFSIIQIYLQVAWNPRGSREGRKKPPKWASQS